MAQFRRRFPLKSRTQIEALVRRSVDQEKKRLLETNRGSSNIRSDNQTVHRTPSQLDNEVQQLNPRVRLTFNSSSERVPVIVPASNAPNQQSPDRSSTGTRSQRKTKQIRKDTGRQAQKEFFRFARHYSEQLRQQHKRWTPHQINTIVRLLWRKKVTGNKRLPDIFERPRSQRSILTGRKYFGDMKRKFYGMDTEEINNSFRHLPQESRKYLYRLTNEFTNETWRNGFSHPYLSMPRTIRFGVLRVIEDERFPNNLHSFIHSV